MPDKEKETPEFPYTEEEYEKFWKQDHSPPEGKDSEDNADENPGESKYPEPSKAIPMLFRKVKELETAIQELKGEKGKPEDAKEPPKVESQDNEPGLEELDQLAENFAMPKEKLEAWAKKLFNKPWTDLTASQRMKVMAAVRKEMAGTDSKDEKEEAEAEKPDVTTKTSVDEYHERGGTFAHLLVKAASEGKI